MNSDQSKPDYSIDSKNFDEYPIKFLKLILKKLKIKELIAQYIKDPRIKGCRYPLHALLMHSIFNHLFRVPSKNHFHQYFKRSNASTSIAKFYEANTNRCPVTRTIDDLLLNLNPMIAVGTSIT